MEKEMEKIAQGAEAVLFKDKERIIKERLAKSYRHPLLDTTLRKSRTRREARVIEKIQSLKLPAPKLLDMCDRNMKIDMDFIEGPLVKEILGHDHMNVSKEIGKNIAQMHAGDIIHGDLTTSNMIMDTNKKLNFIDFGLSFISNKEEDKAVDLHLLRKALESKHHEISDECLSAVHASYLENYPGAQTVLERLKKVEARGRHKSKEI